MPMRSEISARRLRRDVASAAPGRFSLGELSSHPDFVVVTSICVLGLAFAAWLAVAFPLADVAGTWQFASFP